MSPAVRNPPPLTGRLAGVVIIGITGWLAPANVTLGDGHVLASSPFEPLLRIKLSDSLHRVRIFGSLIGPHRGDARVSQAEAAIGGADDFLGHDRHDDLSSLFDFRLRVFGEPPVDQADSHDLVVRSVSCARTRLIAKQKPDRQCLYDFCGFRFRREIAVG